MPSEFEIIRRYFTRPVKRALLGVGGAYFLLTYGDIGKMTNGLFPRFEITSKIMGIGAAVAALLGIIASIMPAIAVARMTVSEGLKTLD